MVGALWRRGLASVTLMCGRKIVWSRSKVSSVIYYANPTGPQLGRRTSNFWIYLRLSRTNAQIGEYDNVRTPNRIPSRTGQHRFSARICSGDPRTPRVLLDLRLV